MDIDFTNDEINEICGRYQKHWPYEALGIEPSEMAKDGAARQSVSMKAMRRETTMATQMGARMMTPMVPPTAMRSATK